MSDPVRLKLLDVRNRSVASLTYWSNQQAGIRRDSLGAISHIKLSQGAFRGNPPVSLVPPVSLLIGFPEA